MSRLIATFLTTAAAAVFLGSIANAHNTVATSGFVAGADKFMVNLGLGAGGNDGRVLTGNKTDCLRNCSPQISTPVASTPSVTSASAPGSVLITAASGRLDSASFTGIDGANFNADLIGLWEPEPELDLNFQGLESSIDRETRDSAVASTTPSTAPAISPIAPASITTGENQPSPNSVGVAATVVPIPEPATYILMLGGLSSLGFLVSRRKGLEAL